MSVQSANALVYVSNVRFFGHADLVTPTTPAAPSIARGHSVTAMTLAAHAHCGHDFTTPRGARALGRQTQNGPQRYRTEKARKGGARDATRATFKTQASPDGAVSAQKTAKLMPEELLVHSVTGEGAFGRGLFATAGGSTLARLPLSRALGVPAALGQELPKNDEARIRDIYVKGWVQNFGARMPQCVVDFVMSAPFAKDVRLTAGLAWATTHVEDWRIYGEEVVPREFDSMYLANEDELEALQDAQIRAMAERSREGYEATWAAAMEAYPAVAGELSSCDARKIEWCRSWVHTRAISGKIGDTECAFLAPTIDLANHRVESTAKYGVSDDGSCFELTWNEEAREGPTPVKGTEVFISYGDRMSNALLMLHYGFIDDNNRNERLPMEFIIPGARKVLGDRVVAAMKTLEARGDTKGAWAASNMLLMASRSPPPGIAAPPTDPSVIQAMRDAVGEYTSKCSTTAAEDEAILGSATDLSPRMSLAIRYRLAQKQNAAAFLRFLDVLL